MENADSSAAAMRELVARRADQIALECTELSRWGELYDEYVRQAEALEALRRDRAETRRRIRLAEGRIAREERRLERLEAGVGGTRRGRPVRVAVDDGAWETLKREAVRRRVSLLWWLGDLLRIEVKALVRGDVVGRPSSRRRRSAAETDPMPRQRFLRVDADDEHWSALRAAALDVDLTVSRYVGELAEQAAHEAGWRVNGRSGDGPRTGVP